MKHKLLIVTEAALENPKAAMLSKIDEARINGVYRTYENLVPHLSGFYDVEFLTPFDYQGPEKSIFNGIVNRNTPFPAPRQNSIRMVIPSGQDLETRMWKIAPTHIHVATEGPLCIAALRYARRMKLPVSSAFHTNWQQYVMENGFHVPLVPRKLTSHAMKNFLTRFHNHANMTMAATPELKSELAAWGLDPKRIHIVSRGIDPDNFRPYPDNEKPVQGSYILYVGRLAPGKGVERFCELNARGLRKVIVGTGPLAEKLRTQYPDVHFAGFAQVKDLPRFYSGAKFFVMPSDTETFGMTVTEALACGTPVVALNRGGHQPILNAAKGLGVMHENLQTALDNAFDNPSQFMQPDEMAAYMARTRSWAKEAKNFSQMMQSAGALAKSA